MWRKTSASARRGSPSSPATSSKSVKQAASPGRGGLRMSRHRSLHFLWVLNRDRPGGKAFEPDTGVAPRAETYPEISSRPASSRVLFRPLACVLHDGGVPGSPRMAALSGLPCRAAISTTPTRSFKPLVFLFPYAHVDLDPECSPAYRPWSSQASLKYSSGAVALKARGILSARRRPSLKEIKSWEAPRALRPPLVAFIYGRVRASLVAGPRTGRTSRRTVRTPGRSST
jgi:hypothetical protein